jgi:hypothetical protein
MVEGSDRSLARPAANPQSHATPFPAGVVCDGATSSSTQAVGQESFGPYVSYLRQSRRLARLEPAQSRRASPVQEPHSLFQPRHPSSKATPLPDSLPRSIPAKPDILPETDRAPRPCISRSSSIPDHIPGTVKLHESSSRAGGFPIGLRAIQDRPLHLHDPFMFARRLYGFGAD